jgi:glycosyltransferase involved in cell wall biosynthesis
MLLEDGRTCTRDALHVPGKSIWCISKYAVPLQYGFGHRLFSLARGFSSLGHTPLVISSDSNHLAQIPPMSSTYTREYINDVLTCWIRTRKYKGSSSILRVLSWLDFELKLWRLPDREFSRPDVVIVSSLSLLTVLNGWRLKRKYRCKLLFEVRDIWPLTMVCEAGYRRWHPVALILGWIERFGYQKADSIIGTMPNLSEHVSKVMGRRIQCHCIPLGYDPQLGDCTEALPDGYAEEYLQRDKLLVGYAGSLGVSNAMEPLIKCAHMMRDHDQVHFLVVGDGALLEEYKAATRSLPNITFAPKVRKQQVPAVLAHCDILYFSARKSEVWRYGQSLNKLVEYMLSGRPIVASYSGYPSMINEAECGVFVPADDAEALRGAILDLASCSREELRTMGGKGRSWILEHRSYQLLAKQYSELF